MIEITFRQRYRWALLPYKPDDALSVREDEQRAYRETFRWARRARSEEHTAWHRAAEEWGWIVPSPIDLSANTLEDLEVQFPDDLQPTRDLAADTGLSEFYWRESYTALAYEKPQHWLRLYRQRVLESTNVSATGSYDTTLAPLGGGFTEIHLGWEMVLPESCMVAFLPLPGETRFVMPLGYINFETAERFNDWWGFLTAIKPVCPMRIRRGQPFARVVVLPADMLKQKAQFEFCAEA